MGFWSSDTLQEPFFLWRSRGGTRKLSNGIILDTLGLSIFYSWVMNREVVEFRKEYLTGFCSVDSNKSIIIYNGRNLRDRTSRYVGTYSTSERIPLGRFILESYARNSLTLDCVIRAMARKANQDFNIRKRGTPQNEGIPITHEQLLLITDLVRLGEDRVPIML
jgi:hypothetical protein